VAVLSIALATRIYYGNGNLSGTFVVNERTTGARTIVTGTAGAYTVNCNEHRPVLAPGHCQDRTGRDADR